MKPSILANGGFEQPALAGWTVSGVVVPESSTVLSGTGSARVAKTTSIQIRPDGHGGFDIITTDIPGILSQVVTRPPDMLWMLEAWVSPETVGLPSPEIRIDGVTVATLEPADWQPGVWYRLGGMVLFPSTVTSIEFGCYSTPDGAWFFDEVSVREREDGVVAVNREAIFEALATRLAAVPSITLVSRRLRSYEDFPAADQPAIFLCKEDEIPVNQRGLPPAWRLQVSLYLLCRTPRDEPSPSSQLNRILTEIETALERQPTEWATGQQPNQEGSHQTTLGGLCQRAWISGPVTLDEGLIDEQAVARIPVEILAVA